MNNKIAIFSDAHFGRSKNDEKILNYSIDYIKNVMIPDLKIRNIETIFFLGDLFDNRNLINVKVQNELYDLFENDLKDFKVYILIGNHDIYYTNTIDTHSIKPFKNFNHIEIIENFKTIEINNVKILMISWLVDLNKLQSIINDNPSEVLMGHFDIVGYQYNKHTICETGINQDIFINKFKTVFSGHFHKHTKRTIDTTTICYIGSPWQIDRNDIEEDRGYIIYDVELKTIEQIVNITTPRFVNIQYPEVLKDIKNNIIDLTITYDSNNFDDEKLQFDSYIETLESLNPYKLNINYESINNLNLDDSNNSKTISFNDFKNSFLQFLNTKNLQEFEINELHYKFSNEYDKETM